MPLHEAHFDVLVIGGGPAGIAAACEASDAGARVGLVEGSPWLGGQIWKDTPQHPASGQGRRWLNRLHKTGVTFLLETRIIGLAGAQDLLAETRDGPLQLHGDTLILATGAREQFMPFPGWTLPGVTGAGGLQALAKSGWPVKDKRVVVAGSGPLLLAVTAEMRAQGAHVVALVEQTGWSSLFAFAGAVSRHPSKIMQGIGLARHLLGTPLLAGWWPTEAHGRDQIERVTLGSHTGSRSIDCDILACGFGLIPNDELARLLTVDCPNGCAAVDAQQRTSVAHIFAAGELTGIAGVDGAIVEGQIAGLAAAGRPQQALALGARQQRWQHFGQKLADAFRPRAELTGLVTDDTIVCRCEDVTWADIKHCESSREARLQYRCGMGHCQGRFCGQVINDLLGILRSEKAPVEPFTPRIPVRPVPFKVLAG